MSGNHANTPEVEFQLRLANFKLDILMEITKILPDSPDPNLTLEFIMDRIFTLVEMEAASILTVDETGDRLQFLLVKGEKAEELTGVKMGVSKGIAGKVYSTGEAVLIENTEAAIEFYRQIDETFGFKTNNLIAVPLKFSGRTIGVLEGINIDAEEIKTAGDLFEIFECLAGLISMVLENSKLLERLSEECDAGKRLLDISRAVNSSLALADVLETVMRVAKNVLNATASSLLLLNKEQKQLEFFVVHGDKKDQLKKFALPMDKGIAGYVATTGKPVISNEVAKDSRFDATLDREVGFSTKSILCVPMMKDDEISGVLEVINKSGGEVNFTEGDLNLLQTIANESAIALKNSLLMQEKNELFSGSLRSLARAVDSKDEYEFGHSERVAHYAKNIGLCFRPDDYKLHELLSIAGYIHDVGKIGIPDAILLKSGRLSTVERTVIQSHSNLSCDIIAAIGRLKDALPAVKHHHERYDGTGYPDGIKGDDIPIVARILSVADAFDAMTSDRPYRAKMSPEAAVEEVRKGAGTQFDPG
ncbi:MAG TPA: GAF domain-containing protein, partial [bacterium]|nr:GAF domain-containing protein [bacterium]